MAPPPLPSWCQYLSLIISFVLDLQFMELSSNPAQRTDPAGNNTVVLLQLCYFSSGLGPWFVSQPHKSLCQQKSGSSSEWLGAGQSLSTAGQTMLNANGRVTRASGTQMSLGICALEPSSHWCPEGRSFLSHSLIFYILTFYSWIYNFHSSQRRFWNYQPVLI